MAVALTYLTKSSALLGASRFFVDVGFLNMQWTPPGAWVSLWRRRSCLLSLSTFPYIHNSKKFFGHYFYNSNSYYIMWHDSWDEAAAPSLIYDTPTVKNIPAENLPPSSPEILAREHTPSRQIWARLWYGIKKLYVRSSQAYGYFKYAVAYLIVFVLSALLRRIANIARTFWPEFPFETIFLGRAIFQLIIWFFFDGTPPHRISVRGFVPISILPVAICVGIWNRKTYKC